MNEHATPDRVGKRGAYPTERAKVDRRRYSNG
jgi:hypothetical protein